MKTEELIINRTLSDFSDEQIRKAMGGCLSGINGYTIAEHIEHLNEAISRIILGNEGITLEDIQYPYLEMLLHRDFYVELAKIALGKENES